MEGCWLCPRVWCSFAGCYDGCWLCQRVGYSFPGYYGWMFVVSEGQVFFRWLLWGDVYCVRRSGILLLAVMGGCWLSPWVGYSFVGCFGGMLVVSECHVFFFWLL